MSQPLERRKARSSKRGPDFHLFPRLPLELRIRVWERAAFERLVIINGNISYGYWSPTPVPPVTRACRESRRYSSYCKHFTAARKHPERYFWINPPRDTIQIYPILINPLSTETKEVVRLRIDLSHSKGWGVDDFFWSHGGSLDAFPGLKSVDILVADELARWTSFNDEGWWWWDCIGVGPPPWMRIVSCRTGEWIDAVNCGVYRDWLDNRERGEGEAYRFTRRVAEDVGSYEARVKRVEEFEGLPKTGLDYW
ncbi:hypothetical protein E8E12_002647 [Didymella heteroderae]|uniref:2EXR domain-containing protein n=1 Tax=Didymella heteroderae TaxID=1769908 RepID=A0A9P5C3K7_9PLEO|nr:hypothetical protein E8E12_002647 [Didymella heteroderae]